MPSYSQANGDKAARTEAARGDVAVFEKLLSEYKGNKGITKDRLVIETLEEVLPNAEIYIMNDDGNTMKYLPLRSLEKEETKKTPALMNPLQKEKRKKGMQRKKKRQGKGALNNEWKNNRFL